MSKSDAIIGYGTTLELALASAPTIWHYIAEAKKHTPPGYTASQVEKTHMQSPRRMREFAPGLGEAGSSSHEMNWVPGSPTNRFLMSARGKELIARLTVPTGEQIIYRCSIEGDSGDIPLDATMSSTLGLKVSGDPTLTDVAAPRNLVLPTIDGVARVGVPLLLEEGVWAGAEEVTYQWRAAGTVISGATMSSYTPVAGDVGDVITVAVTGINAAFSTEVISAATAAVLAAA
jgi:hypothetical protein